MFRFFSKGEVEALVRFKMVDRVVVKEVEVEDLAVQVGLAAAREDQEVLAVEVPVDLVAEAPVADVDPAETAAVGQVVMAVAETEEVATEEDVTEEDVMAEVEMVAVEAMVVLCRAWVVAERLA